MYIASVFRVLKRLKLTSVYFIKHTPAFRNAGGHKNLAMKNKVSTSLRLQRYYKFSIYANFARKIW